MNADLLIHSASQVLTLAGGPQRGSRLGQLGLIEDGAVAVEGGRVVVTGPSEEVRRRYSARLEIDASGRVVLPGLRRPPHPSGLGRRPGRGVRDAPGGQATWRSWPPAAASSPPSAGRAGPVEELVAEARARLQRMLAHGTTTAEAKTGYGLETAAELRMLEAILRLDAEGPIELAPTFLGAHAVPPEYRGRADDYADLCQEMLPAVQRLVAGHGRRSGRCPLWTSSARPAPSTWPRAAAFWRPPASLGFPAQGPCR